MPFIYASFGDEGSVDAYIIWKEIDRFATTFNLQDDALVQFEYILNIAGIYRERINLDGIYRIKGWIYK